MNHGSIGELAIAQAAAEAKAKTVNPVLDCLNEILAELRKMNALWQNPDTWYYVKDEDGNWRAEKRTQVNPP